MGRSAGGNYSLAAGNPVTTNTTISTTWANSTLDDIASALTDSLSRSGLGGMQQPLKLTDGISGAPALTFTAETSSGFYRADTGILGLSLLGVDYLFAGDGEFLVPKVLHGQNGLTITQSAANTAGATITGNGTAAGGVFTGGSSGGRGLTVTGGAGNGVGAVITGGSTGAGATIAAGGGNAVGATITGAGSGTGLAVTGGATGWGVNATGTIGVVATGTTTEGVAGIGAAGQAGVKSRAGTAATATTAQTALYVEDGYIGFRKSDLGAAVNPNSDVAFTNKITPKNVAKAWAKLTTTGGSSTTITIDDGFNIASATLSGAAITLNIADDVSSNGIAVITTSDVSIVPHANCTGSAVGITALDLSVGVSAGNPFPNYNFENDSSVVLYVVVYGAQ